MFLDAASFNQNIGSWNVSSVTNIEWMFTNVSSFNKRINSELSIGQKAVIVIADAQAKTYGDHNPALTAVVDGTVNKDGLIYKLATDTVRLASVLFDFDILVYFRSFYESFYEICWF
jgi:surface protein